MIGGKFLKVKKWINLSEAADRLSSSLEETVTILDLLELGLAGELRISVKLPYTNKYVVREAYENVVLYIDKLKEFFPFMLLKDGNEHVIEGTDEYNSLFKEYLDSEYKKHVVRTMERQGKEEQLTREFFNTRIKWLGWEYPNGIAYLSENILELLIGGSGCIELESMIEMNKRNATVELCNLDGIFLKSLSGKVYNLMERFADKEIERFNIINKVDTYSNQCLNPRHYFPMEGLPAYTEFGIMTEHLFEFERKLCGGNNEHSPEYLLCVIGGMLNTITAKTKKWTQGEIAVNIGELGINNLGERKINEVFSNANKEYKKITSKIK